MYVILSLYLANLILSIAKSYVAILAESTHYINIISIVTFLNIVVKVNYANCGNNWKDLSFTRNFIRNWIGKYSSDRLL